MEQQLFIVIILTKVSSPWLVLNTHKKKSRRHAFHGTAAPWLRRTDVPERSVLRATGQLWHHVLVKNCLEIHFYDSVYLAVILPERSQCPTKAPPFWNNQSKEKICHHSKWAKSVFTKVVSFAKMTPMSALLP